MNKARLHCVRATAWAFTAVLASTSALGAEAVVSWLTLEQQHSYPRLAWPNVPGHTYSIQTRERLAGGDWSSVVTLTTDAKAGTWAEETGPGATRFHGVGAQANTNCASKLQPPWTARAEATAPRALRQRYHDQRPLAGH